MISTSLATLVCVNDHVCTYMGIICIHHTERGRPTNDDAAILQCKNTLKNQHMCNTLQHTATHCIILQHTATHCNTLQHTATHCNTLHYYNVRIP